MLQKRVIQSKSYNIYEIYKDNSQIYITAVILDEQADQISVCKEIYSHIASSISSRTLHVVQERIFGSIELQNDINTVRIEMFSKNGIATDLPVTYIQGNPMWEKGCAGIQLIALTSNDKEQAVRTLFDGTTPYGISWKRYGTTYTLIQNIHGASKDSEAHSSRHVQTAHMFDQSMNLLQKVGMDFNNVIRTWIYLSNILDWYNEFNLVRNEKFKEFKLLPGTLNGTETEKIYLPASTGIEGKNSYNAAAVMDVLAIQQESASPVIVTHHTGSKQRSPYRYGSAFSRSTVIREPDGCSMYISGTASIDEEGKSQHINNSSAQIRYTFDVVDSLISKEGASLKDICQATVFLKNKNDYAAYVEVIQALGINDLPAVCVIADVCRDELLFEIDGIAIT